MVKEKTVKPELLAVSIMLIVAILIKWQMINYGLPHTVHVDESMVLKNPFKLLLNYKNGDFSESTTFFNWVSLGYFLIVFVGGWLLDFWSTFGEFEIFLISDSAGLILTGRFLSLLLSTMANLIFLKLVFKNTTQTLPRILFAGIVLFNPIELNSVNWIKYEAIVYLFTVINLYLANDYFLQKREAWRNYLYIFSILSVSVRIEFVAFVVGFFMVDAYDHKNKLLNFLRSLIRPALVGAVGFMLITLYPLKFLIAPPADHLLTSKTYEAAILNDLSLASIISGIKGSTYYIQALIALLGPITALFAGIFLFRKYTHLATSFALLAGVLIIYPVKNVHYLMAISVIAICGFIHISQLFSPKIFKAVIFVSFLWCVSFSIEQAFLIARVGDLRITATDYILENTEKNDTLYVEGIFSQIRDKPERYRIKVDAAKEIGSTGKSNEYLAGSVGQENTRSVITVSDFEPFAETKYANLFNNKYDSILLKEHNPDVYLIVKRINQPKYPDGPFYQFLLKRYTEIKSFQYNLFDPRLQYTNFYYFHNVYIYTRKNKV